MATAGFEVGQVDVEHDPAASARSLGGDPPGRVDVRRRGRAPHVDPAAVADHDHGVAVGRVREGVGHGDVGIGADGEASVEQARHQRRCRVRRPEPLVDRGDADLHPDGGECEADRGGSEGTAPTPTGDAAHRVHAERGHGHQEGHDIGVVALRHVAERHDGGAPRQTADGHGDPGHRVGRPTPQQRPGADRRGHDERGEGDGDAGRVVDEVEGDVADHGTARRGEVHEGQLVDDADTGRPQVVQEGGRREPQAEQAASCLGEHLPARRAHLGVPLRLERDGGRVAELQHVEHGVGHRRHGGDGQQREGPGRAAQPVEQALSRRGERGEGEDPDGDAGSCTHRRPRQHGAAAPDRGGGERGPRRAVSQREQAREGDDRPRHPPHGRLVVHPRPAGEERGGGAPGEDEPEQAAQEATQAPLRR